MVAGGGGGEREGGRSNGSGRHGRRRVEKGGGEGEAALYRAACTLRLCRSSRTYKSFHPHHRMFADLYDYVIFAVLYLQLLPPPSCHATPLSLIDI